MNYFEQIGFNNDANLKLLMGGNGCDTITTLEKKILFKNHVEIINLELSYKCNRKCDYCPVSFSTRQDDQSYLSEKLLNKVCNELSEIRFENKISLNLYNEPLLDENLEDKIKIIKHKLPFSHVGFNSNGDYLRKNRLESLANSGLNYICITLHPLPNVIQSTSTIIKRIKKLADRLDFIFDDLFINEEVVKTQTSLEIKLYGVRIIIQWPNWRENGTNRAGTLTNHTTANFKRITPCVKPFREFTIFFDGNVQPCCEAFHDNKISLENVGSLETASIYDLYTSKKLNLLRRSLYDFSEKKGICASCTAPDFSQLKDDNTRKALLKEIHSQDLTKIIPSTVTF